MKDFSILGMKMEEVPETVPEYFADLNLDYLIREFARADSEEAAEYYYRMPADRETVLYRMAVMKELEEGEMEERLRAFSRRIHQAIEHSRHSREAGQSMSRAHWHLLAAHEYFTAVEEWKEYLEEKNPSSQGWKDFLTMCREITGERKYRENYERLRMVYEKMSNLRYSIRIEGDHISILPRVLQEDYVGELRQRFPESIDMPDRLYTLLPGSQESSALEQRIFQYIRKKNPEPFEEMERLLAECPEFYSGEIMKFHREIAFYLSFQNFRHYMEERGHCFCYPAFVEGEMTVTGGYDLALAFKNLEEGKKTVGNDYYFQEQEQFLVVTGPNQGGKTTFGRAAGQLVYFSRMGLPVPAEHARLPYFEGMVTHFSVEESMESGRGKLKEELVRLAPIMHSRQRNVFVVINELFTSAAAYDAYQMGRRVMEHFLGHGCYGIYVTHIEELAEETEQIVSMTAALEGGDSPVRTYKIFRQPAGGGGYVETIVEQYGLTYENIMRRLAHD
ncbi:MAG: hypothetical protein J1F22_09220 [Lachnospiraceae bacterium]|nr:hypothetical protein [Lachnospiraceae bacterium]